MALQLLSVAAGSYLSGLAHHPLALRNKPESGPSMLLQSLRTYAGTLCGSTSPATSLPPPTRQCKHQSA